MEGEWIDLFAWTFSDAVNQAQSDNRISVTCKGADVEAYVNDQEVGSVTDDTLADGYAGAMAGSFDPPDVHVVFDCIVVEAMSAD